MIDNGAGIIFTIPFFYLHYYLQTYIQQIENLKEETRSIRYSLIGI